MAGDKPAAAQTPALANIQLQTASYGAVIPIVYGTHRVSANVIWSDDFISVEHDQPQDVGKGGGTLDQSVYSYSGSIMLALCEGPVKAIDFCWRDKDLLPLRLYMGGGFFSVVPGIGIILGLEVTNLGARFNATPWSFLFQPHKTAGLLDPLQMVSYAGTAYMAGAMMNLPDGQLPQHSFAIEGFCALYLHEFQIPLGAVAGNPVATFENIYGPRQTALSAGLDAHPADIIIDLFGNREYGLGWPSSRIQTDLGADGSPSSSFRTYCHAMSFYMSPCMSEQHSALDWLDEWLEQTNSAAVWSQGFLKIIPYGDVATSGNGYDYFPDQTALYDVGVDDFIVSGDAPVRVERTALADTFNDVPVQFKDRTQDYKDTVIDDPDLADIEAFGLRMDQVHTTHGITRYEHALAISRLMAQRSCYVRNMYHFTLPMRYILVEPMDLLTLTEPQLGLNKTVVRIIDIQENEDGTFEMTGQEWPFGVGVHTEFGPQEGDGSAQNWQADPGDSFVPAAIIPTLQMTGGDLELWIATSGGTDWGGADVYVSDDNASFSFVGTAKRAKYGSGSVSNGLGNNISPTDTSFLVGLATSGPTLDNLSTLESATTAGGAADDLTQVYVGGEVVSYQGATMASGISKWTLTGVLRGRQMTSAAAHSFGDLVIRLDSGIFKHPIAYSRLGQTVFIKLVSFNLFGAHKQDISMVASYAFAIPSDPNLLPAPSNASVTFSSTP
jgi:hypothetical protein